jgi:hypothetical protein
MIINYFILLIRGVPVGTIARVALPPLDNFIFHPIYDII